MKIGLARSHTNAFDTDKMLWKTGDVETRPTSRSAENTMLIHLPIVILTSLHPTLVADSPPKFDIARECRSEGGSNPVQERCTVDEKRALDQLQHEWMQFSPSARTQCNSETTTDGTASYVEFLTCLEMERDLTTEGNANKTPK
jgi:hypothetical protein